MTVFFLGLGYNKFKDGLWVATQTAYIDKFRVVLQNTKPCMTQMEMMFRVTDNMINVNAEPERVLRNQSFVWSTTYAQLWTRPDIRSVSTCCH